jgi:hypothetical protein
VICGGRTLDYRHPVSDVVNGKSAVVWLLSGTQASIPSCIPWELAQPDYDLQLDEREGRVEPLRRSSLPRAPRDEKWIALQVTHLLQ